MKANKFKHEIKYDPIRQKTKPYWMLQVEQSKTVNRDKELRDGILGILLLLAIFGFFVLFFYVWVSW